MHVLVAGSSGFVGRALVPRLRADGHRVTRLVRPGRSAAGGDTLAWTPETGDLDAAALHGVDAIVHLGGASLASLWTRRRKELLRNSRIQTTSLLAERIAAAGAGPRVFVHASAVGVYGDRGDEVLTESSPPGTGFLADVCRDWEGASRPASVAGARVVAIRTGLVLSKLGGILPLMAIPFRLGLGGRFGSGRQWMPWVGLEDVTAIYARAIADPAWRGAVNAVAPEAVTNAEFARALGRALRRPAILAVPGIAIRMLPGGMGREMLLTSEHVVPKTLLDCGFRYQTPAMGQVLADLAGRSPGP